MMTTMNEEKKNRTEHKEKESGWKSDVDKERRDKCERYVCLCVQKRKMLSFRWWRSGAGAHDRAKRNFSRFYDCFVYFIERERENAKRQSETIVFILVFSFVCYQTLNERVRF